MNCVHFVYNTLKQLIILFLNCKIVENFWKDIEDWISTKLRVNIVLSSVNKLFGFQEKGVGFQFLNSLLLSARFLIYRCKYSNAKPNMLQYFNSLSITKQTEYIVAKKNSKLDKHFRKWYFIGAPV